ncbi:hypothetical protein DEFDS_0435 [Deferribacter desulfuricans SSM1]|uniref:Uncharacterized protein n=1 Tax=Deferribacter desulfuricans (strain DSM 14783 / JCM 11476 / NBRC 101012 / SSM1) TaxID=639282 RepID=D3PBF6_DEFDS|nr:hypothetical protein [Deferribacter desulfuricans]BAI79929.1 hypothetical protein DEFDS_0435 [Deferribacter desulfuricans SSM1]
MKIDNTKLSNIISKEPPKLKIGETVNVKLVRLLENNVYLVSIKGKILKAILNSRLALSKFRAEVVKLEPILELKMVKDPLQSMDSLKLKQIIYKLSKSEIFNSLKELDNFNIKKIDKEEIKKLIKDSGIFLERKIIKNEDVSDDTKLLLLKKGGGEDNITKLQINYLINGELILPFKAEKYDVSDGAIKIKSKDGNFYVSFHVNLSEIGDVLVKLVHYKNGEIKGKIFTDEKYKSFFDKLSVDDIDLVWAALNVEDIDKEFNIDDKLYSSIGRFEIII